MKTYNIEYDNTVEVVVADDFTVVDGVLLFQVNNTTVAALNNGWKRVWIVDE